MSWASLRPAPLKSGRDLRQSTLAQVERNTESTARQYGLVSRARQLGWPASQVRVVDGDLGISGSVTGQRDASEGLVAEVALGQVGIILALARVYLRFVCAGQHGCWGGLGVLPMSALGGVAGEAEDLDELVLDRRGAGEHAVCSGPAAVTGVEQDGLAYAGEFGEQRADG